VLLSSILKYANIPRINLKINIDLNRIPAIFLVAREDFDKYYFTNTRSEKI
jgi:hypothetical protein